METKTLILTSEEAAIVQKHHEEKGCTILDLGLAADSKVKVTISGESDEIDGLLEMVKNA